MLKLIKYMFLVIVLIIIVLINLLNATTNAPTSLTTIAPSKSSTCDKYCSNNIVSESLIYLKNHHQHINTNNKSINWLYLSLNRSFLDIIYYGNDTPSHKHNNNYVLYPINNQYLQNIIIQPIDLTTTTSTMTTNQNFSDSYREIKNVKQQQQHQQHKQQHERTDNDKLNLYEDSLLRTLSKRYLNMEPPFDASISPTASTECKVHTQQFFNGLENFEFWAMKMHDASAKLPSGILNGNVNQYGDFDQCMSVNSPSFNKDTDSDFEGQYCLAYLQPIVPDNLKRLKRLHSLVQSHGAFRSEFDDPGHRVPRFSTINWALCVPSSCTFNDVENSLKMYLKNFTLGTGIQFKVRVDEEMCQRKTTEPLDQGTKIAGLFFIFILFISVLSTIYDFKMNDNIKNAWCVAFSLRKNTLSMFSLKRDTNDIASVHGIRFFNAVMLIIAHKSMALFFNPYVNRTDMTELLGRPWTVIGRAASLYTDPFIMLSGLLTTYSLVGRLERNQPIRIVQEYIGRLLRIVPTLGALILFCTYILPLIGSGPQWNLVVTHHSDICKSYWWRNLLFIHNYFGFEKMCLTHTHHVGIDTQLFLTAPFAVLLLWKWPKKGGILILFIAIMSTIARFYVTMTRGLSNYVFFGTSVQQLFATADYMYILPAHRATVYIMGILIGYLLRKFKNIKLTKWQIYFGWIVNTLLILGAFFGPAPMGSINYTYNPTHAAHYAAFAPIAWCSFFAWIIITSHLGYETTLSKALSWKGFLITTRLSYAIYLTQFPVFFYNVGRTRNSDYYEFIRMTININEISWIVLTSIILTLLFDSPFQNIKKILFQTRQQPQVTKLKQTHDEMTTTTLLHNNNNNNNNKLSNNNNKILSTGKDLNE